MSEKLKGMFGKKFIAACIGGLATAIMNYFEVSTDVQHQVIGLVMSYIVGQGMADLGKNAK